jgi:alpha-amylase
LDKKEENVNLFMSYDTFGGIQPKESGIFEFLKFLPRKIFSLSNLSFGKPSEVAEKFQPVATLSVPHAISWADEERDTSAWLGNELQKEAFAKLYKLRDNVREISDSKIITDWRYLQTSDHFYYMSTKFFHQGSVQAYFNPYNSPYDAFINYMNILSDFEIRVNNELTNQKSGKAVSKKNKAVSADKVTEQTNSIVGKKEAKAATSKPKKELAKPQVTKKETKKAAPKKEESTVKKTTKTAASKTMKAEEKVVAKVKNEKTKPAKADTKKKAKK